jgi:hypothetical protein
VFVIFKPTLYAFCILYLFQSNVVSAYSVTVIVLFGQFTDKEGTVVHSNLRKTKYKKTSVNHSTITQADRIPCTGIINPPLIKSASTFLSCKSLSLSVNIKNISFSAKSSQDMVYVIFNTFMALAKAIIKIRAVFLHCLFLLKHFFCYLFCYLN